MTKSPSSSPKHSIGALMKRFPDDDACLEHIFRTRYGKRFECPSCERQAHYSRVKKRRAYQCEFCGHQEYPTAGTPFENTRTPLTDWFRVMFMFTTSRNGVAAKQVQREIGVTYKTAWRMCNLIRQYIGFVDGDGPIGGRGGKIVEADKTFIGGKDKQGHDDKAVVLGVMERGGNVITAVIPTRKQTDVQPHLAKWILKNSHVATDEAHAFSNIWRLGHRHGTVNHRKGEYVNGEIHTNSIEGFWANVKRGISGTHIHVSKKWLQTYLWEFEFRHNFRKNPHHMLELLLLAFPHPDLAKKP